MAIVALVPAAGAGERLGLSQPKAFVDVGGAAMVTRAVEGLAPSVDVVIVIVPAELVDHTQSLVPPGTVVVAGGVERTDSVRRGLAALAGLDRDTLAGDDAADIVLVHDAARPLTPRSVTDRVIAAVKAGAPAVIPVLPVVDTVKHVDDEDLVQGTVDRSSLRSVQTPQGFTHSALTQAYRNADIATDDAGLAERAGIPVRVVDGDPKAFKITTQWDLRLAEWLLSQ